MPEADTLFSIGELVAGTYEVRRVIGEGGMGRVYAAHDVLLRRMVALKASWPRFDRALLLKEAQALASIRHAGTVEVFAAGEHRGIAFFAMELLSGEDLAAFIERRRGEVARLGLGEALDILIPVADALAAMHRAGLAHRDVKPANVMLTPSNGRIVLMDFGLFQPESDARPIHSGTPEYMAPELLLDKVEPRHAFLVDVYALGITAYELFAGELPLVGSTPIETVSRQLQQEPKALLESRPDVSRRLATLVHEMLAKEPLERPPSMDEVLFRLRAARTALDAQPIVDSGRSPSHGRASTPGMSATRVVASKAPPGDRPRPPGTGTDNDDDR